MKSTSFDTIIVGGGIIGGMIAWRLAKEQRKVLVLEANRIGMGATCAGAGMLGAQVEIHEPGPLYELAVYSRSLFSQFADELKEESKIDIELDRTGIIRLATSIADRDFLKRCMEWQLESGQPAEWIEPEAYPVEIQEIVRNTYGAVYLPLDYQVRNTQYIQAVAVASMNQGVKFLEHSPVQSLLRESPASNKIIGVQTATDTFYANEVILAAGAWTGILAKTAGIALGVYPVKGQAILVNSRPHLTPYTLFTHGTYLVPKHMGQTYIGATEDKVGFDARPLAKNVRFLLNSAENFLPQIDELEFDHTFVGLRPASHDGLPYIGPHRDFDGLYIAAGHWRNGVLLSAATGILMADILANRAAEIDISAFDPSRQGT